MKTKKTEITQVTMFTQDTLGEFRTITQKGNIFFVAKDICKCLDITNHIDAIKKVLDEEDVMYTSIKTEGGKQRVAFVNESGLYQLIFASRKPEAKAFRKWVTSEVLPSIRKTGKYALPHWVKNEEEGREIQRMVDQFLGKTPPASPISDEEWKKGLNND